MKMNELVKISIDAIIACAEMLRCISEQQDSKLEELKEGVGNPDRKHGRWTTLPIEDGCWQMVCSLCGGVSPAWDEFKYCPHCGAKMENGGGKNAAD